MLVFLIFFKECWSVGGESGVDVGAEGLLESVDAGVACLWVTVVPSVDENVGGIVGVVGVANGTSELSVVLALEWPLACWQ